MQARVPGGAATVANDAPAGARRAGAPCFSGLRRCQRAVGIVNSAPFAVLSGQRCMTDFWRV